MRRRDHERIVHGFERQIVWLQRQNEELLNRLMYASDKTWTPPPMVMDDAPDPFPDYTLSPEHELGAEPYDEPLTLP